MSTFESKDIRNIALVGHKGTGKTSAAEAMLFTSGVTTRLNKVDDGNSILDTDPEEQKRISSLALHVANCEWKGAKINILDTPGDGNFFQFTQNAICVAEGIISFVSAPDGVEAQTLRTYKMADERKIPKIIFISKMDRERADFLGCFKQIKERMAPDAIPMVLPIGKEDSFKGIVDLINMNARIFESDGKGKFHLEDVPADMLELAKEQRYKLMEEVAGTDEKLLDKFMETDELSQEELVSGTSNALKNHLLTPVLVGSAVRNMGIPMLMDMIVNLMPSPLEGPLHPSHDKDGKEVEIPRDQHGDTNAIVFTTLVDQHAGKINIMKVLSGTLSSDSTIYNVRKNNNQERLGTLLALQGRKTEGIDKAVMGDICGVAKLKDTDTGDTLASTPDAPQLDLPPIPPILISYRLLPKNKNDIDKIGQGIKRLQEEDQAYGFGHDEITQDLVLSGCGVTHLEVALERLRRRYGIDVDLAPINVPYRETITKRVDNIEGKHKKQSGGRGQFGVAILNVMPNPGKGYEYVNCIVGGAIPKQWIPSVDKGIQNALKQGIVAGYPVVDIKVECIDGKYHDVDSSEMSFQIAGSKGIKAAMAQAKPVILEPIMEMEVIVPEENMGDIMGNLNSRRGRILGMDTKDGLSTIKANVPMAEVLMFAPDLHSVTAGRGTFTMKLVSYERVPDQLVPKIVADSPVKPKAEEEE